jgi:t-SNARE complex subunit (syntaxin)
MRGKAVALPAACPHKGFAFLFPLVVVVVVVVCVCRVILWMV